MDRNTYRENVLVPLSPPFSWTPPFFRGQMDNPPFIIDSKNFPSPFSEGGGGCWNHDMSFVAHQLHFFIPLCTYHQNSSKLVETHRKINRSPDPTSKLVETCRSLSKTSRNSLKLVETRLARLDEQGRGGVWPSNINIISILLFPAWRIFRVYEHGWADTSKVSCNRARSPPDLTTTFHDGSRHP